jgi:hypothetical protein
VSAFKERFLGGMRAHPYVHASAAIAIIVTGSMLAQTYVMALAGKAPPPPFTVLGFGLSADLAMFALSVLAAWGWVVLVLRAHGSRP